MRKPFGYFYDISENEEGPIYQGCDDKKIMEIVAKEFKNSEVIPLYSSPKFKVFISKMIESHRTTYWVTIHNLDIYNKAPFNSSQEGCITPYMSESLSNARYEAKTWAGFLGVEVEIEDYKEE